MAFWNFAVLNLTKCLIAWGNSQQCLQAVVHPLLQGQGLSKERDRARLCTHWMSTILGRSQSEVIDLNIKGVIIFGGKNRALTLKLWW